VKNEGRVKGDEMSLGFILIKAAPVLEHKVYNKLLKIQEIIELQPLFGEYDLIAKIEAEDFEKLGEIIITKIRSVKGVIDTKTLTGTRF
jgi:DNA-binding Lrp family transcriptional regulator